MMSPNENDHLFLRACRGESIERVPVWMMRQAGRYLPEYRAIRARSDFLTLCKTPALASEVTVQPVDIVGVDAAIVFADILLVPEAMGLDLAFVKGDGPVFDPPIRKTTDLDRLTHPDVQSTLGYVFEAIAETRRALAGRVPVIGFAGTPWTVGSYVVEGGTSKNHAHLLAWSHRDPQGLRQLLDRLAAVTIDYLIGQIDAGAQALQLFDTWGGLLSPERFTAIALPSLERVIAGIADYARDRQVPLIYYGNGTGHLLEVLATLPVDVLSVDWRRSLSSVREQIGSGKALQGNLDPTTLLATPEIIEQATRTVLESGRGGAHIMNLGHGILPMTPVANARAFIDAVKTHGQSTEGTAP